MHGAAAEDVAVQVRDGFAAVGAVVDDEAVAGGARPSSLATAAAFTNLPSRTFRTYKERGKTLPAFLKI